MTTTPSDSAAAPTCSACGSAELRRGKAELGGVLMLRGLGLGSTTAGLEIEICVDCGCFRPFAQLTPGLREKLRTKWRTAR
jgi:hypothetical protein